MNVTELLITNGIADNQFRAGHIATGLRLWECETDEAKLERARLYRAWRNSGVYKKSDTKSCYEKAIAGEKVPVLNSVDSLKLYCPKCENEVIEGLYNIWDCLVCETKDFYYNMDKWQGETKGETKGEPKSGTYTTGEADGN